MLLLFLSLLQENGVQELIQKLRSDDIAVREKATQALFEAGDSAVRALRVAATSQDQEQASRAREVLAKLIRAHAAAIQEQARTPAKESLKKIEPFLFQGDQQLRIAAAQGLGNFIEYKELVTPLLMSALSAPANVKEPEVQAAIYEGLGRLADPTSLDTVHKGFRDEQMKVATGAIACAGAMRLKESMDPLVGLLRDIDNWLAKNQGGPYKDEKGRTGEQGDQRKRLEDIQEAGIKALQDITKEKWSTAKEWQVWWDKHKATFEVPR